jgi:phospholipase/carboxylesterase
MHYLPAVELEYPKGRAVNASIIWLHGLGADGNDFAPIVPQMRLPEGLGVRFIFPHAPSIPVTVNNGYVMPAWYDIKQMDVDRHVDLAQLQKSAGWVHDFIDREIERGVSSEHILIAGFSQGGAVAYEAALSYPKKLGGIMAFSTYFPTAASVQVDAVQRNLPILICHGSRDPVVPETLGIASKMALETMGFQPEYRSYPMEHAVCPQQINDIADWIGKHLA